ncbi:MAG: hypothetical protein ACYS6I_07525, partial [Planctomycetota bacterium]
IEITDRETINTVINILNGSSYRAHPNLWVYATKNGIVVYIYDNGKRKKAFEVVSDILFIYRRWYGYQFSDGFQSSLRKALGAREYGMDKENNSTRQSVQQ